MTQKINWIPKLLLSAFTKLINFTESNKMYVMLLSSAPDINAIQFVSDIRAKEIAQDSSYTTNGQVVTNCAMTVNGAVVTFSADNLSWAAAPFTTTHGALYYKGGTDATSPVAGILDFGGSQTPNGSTFRIEWNNAGIGTGTITET